MSELRIRIESDLKDAMRQKDELARETLRMALAGVKNRRIELGRELEDPDVLDVLRKAVKSRADSAQQYDDAARPELAEKERAEIGIIERYLPQQATPEQTEEFVRAAIEETGASSKADLGKVMKAVMAKHKDVVDGKLVSGAAGRLLG